MLKTAVTTLGLSAVLALGGCALPEEPPTAHVVVLSGTPYERGFQHGARFSAHIRSLYTRLLTASILPFLNREQINIAPILLVYNGPDYRSGQFSDRLLLESGRHLFDNYIPAELQEEMRGVADGAELPLDQIIVLNTFVDTMLAFRSVVAFIQHIQTPLLVEVELQGGLQSDGVDNNVDGQTDEPGEGLVGPYAALPHALMLEVPTDASVRMLLEDPAFEGLACVDPRNVEPATDLAVAARCVHAECVAPECAGRALLGRECFTGLANDCLDPRLHAECFDPTCVDAADPGCVDVESVRIRLDGQLFVTGDEGLTVRRLPLPEDPEAEPSTQPPYRMPDCQGQVEVVLRPPGGLPPAALVHLDLEVADRSPIYSPTPYHQRPMRPERLAFTTAGYHARTGDGERRTAVPNRGVPDPAAQPPSLSFAARRSATADGTPLLAHHFALLDTGIVHEHAAVFVHEPEQGQTHAVVGWTGIIWGFAGMNAAGLAYSANGADTLDNPLIGGMLEDILLPENLLILLEEPNLAGLTKVLAERRLLATGMPVGLAGRMLLTHGETVTDGLQTLYDSGRTFGWTYLLADASGELAAVEVDGAVQTWLSDDEEPSATPRDEDGFLMIRPGSDDPPDLTPDGRPWASSGPDDLRTASHFHKNLDDMRPIGLMGIFSPRRQPEWAMNYFRSVRADALLAEAVAARLGRLDVATAIEILRMPELVDERDSMNAVVFEPAAARLHWAAGGVPATDQPFRTLDLHAPVEGAYR